MAQRHAPVVEEMNVPASFHSILFGDAHAGSGGDVDERDIPACFADLNLDQIVESVTAGREGYQLEPFFYAPLNDVGMVTYRHDVFRDLERPAVSACIGTFAQQMRAMRGHLAQANKLHYKYQKERWFLDAAEIYGDAVIALADDLARADVRSHGLQAFCAYLTAYAASDGLTALRDETKKLKADLSEVRYCLHIKNSRIRVSKYDGEADYSVEVQATFEKFRQGAVKDYRVEFSNAPEMNHVEAEVLDLVARLFPEVFLALDQYCDGHRRYLDATIGRFDREVQFYVAYLEYIDRFKPAGLTFCYPRVSDQSKAVRADDTFDAALATKLVSEHAAMVCNDFSLQGRERICVVTGPNQGGKTTFARTFGQLHYLASLGCPVPGRDARLFLCDRLFTHFEKEENLENLRSKLEDDLVRMREILGQATANSIVIMNEIFTSTTLEDALYLGTEILEQLIRLDLLCVCVTFVDEWASLGETTVSMASTVVPDNPAARTYKIVRKPADGLAYAAAIAEKYRLTYESLKGRIKERSAV